MIEKRHLAAGVILLAVEAVVCLAIAGSGHGRLVRKRYEGH
jgi:hypothetical protein